MTDSQTSLSELLEINRDGADFYEHAAQSVDDARLRKLFTQLAQMKSELATDMSGEVPAKAARRGKATGPVAEFQRTYADLRKNLRKPDGGQIDVLEQAEGKLHTQFQQLVLDRDQTFVVRVLAKRYLSKVDPLHREIRARKRDLP